LEAPEESDKTCGSQVSRVVAAMAGEPTKAGKFGNLLR